MRALVVRFTAIGDCVMAVPVASAIRAKYPDAHITWAVEPYCSPVIDTERLVNEAILFPRDDWQRHRWSPKTWRDQLKTYLSMRGRNFDIGIDLQGHAKTAMCLRLAKPRKRIAVAAKDLVAKRLNPKVEVGRMDKHTIEHGLFALSKLEDFPTDVQFIMPRLRAECEAVSKRLTNGKPLATISISAGGSAKIYPVDRWATVAQGLISRGFQVAFLGGPKDPASPLPSARDWVGKLTLRESMAAVSLSAIHLAADTGSGHMAAAYNVAVVSVFGTTSVRWYRPYTSNGIVLDGQGAISAITPDQILDASDRLLERSSEAISS
jgi:ADP-heptose:LPS heptosyltransferase